MDYYLILARSITYAQRMREALESFGIRCRYFRAPRELTERGCAYAVEVGTRDFPQALVALHREGLDPLQVYLYQRGTYREVPT